MQEEKNSQTQAYQLLIVVVQGQDADLAIDSLTDGGFTVTRLPSVGGFLGRKNATLMVGVDDVRKEEAIAILNKNCRQRVAFIAVPMENSPLPMPAPTPVTIGGANIFFLDVDHYEEF
ncbi:MAG: cyclic-di-AMP receptor [Brevefilum sp.]